LPEKWPPGGLKQLWSKPIGGGYSGISALGGRVFTMDRQTQPAETERVLCLDADMGEPVWIHEYAVTYGDLDYGSGPRSQPTVQDGHVYTLGAMGHLHCLDAETGEVIWSVDTVAEFCSIPGHLLGMS
jgi:outer membrane protein assembly factor BamB